MKAREHKKIVKQLVKTHEQKMEELRQRVSSALEEQPEMAQDNEVKE